MITTSAVVFGFLHLVYVDALTNEDAILPYHAAEDGPTARLLPWIGDRTPADFSPAATADVITMPPRPGMRAGHCYDLARDRETECPAGLYEALYAKAREEWAMHQHAILCRTDARYCRSYIEAHDRDFDNGGTRSRHWK